MSHPRPPGRSEERLSSFATCPVSGATSKAKPHGRRSHEGSLPIFLPPYSPDLNPIEQLFVNLNQLMRKAERAETFRQRARHAESQAALVQIYEQRLGACDLECQSPPPSLSHQSRAGCLPTSVSPPQCVSSQLLWPVTSRSLLG